MHRSDATFQPFKSSIRWIFSGQMVSLICENKSFHFQLDQAKKAILRLLMHHITSRERPKSVLPLCLNLCEGVITQIFGTWLWKIMDWDFAIWNFGYLCFGIFVFITFSGSGYSFLGRPKAWTPSLTKIFIEFQGLQGFKNSQCNGRTIFLLKIAD